MDHHRSCRQSLFEATRDCLIESFLSSSSQTFFSSAIAGFLILPYTFSLHCPPPEASTCSVYASDLSSSPYTFSLHCLHLLCLRLRFLILPLHLLPSLPPPALYAPPISYASPTPSPSIASTYSVYASDLSFTPSQARMDVLMYGRKLTFVFHNLLLMLWFLT